MSPIRSVTVAAQLLLIVTSTAVAGAGRPALSGADAPADAKSSEIRVTLGRILGAHAFLLMALMRAEAAEAPERDAVRAAVNDNWSSS